MLHCDLRDDPTMRNGCVATALAAVTGVPCSRWVAKGRELFGPRTFSSRGVTTYELRRLADVMGYHVTDVPVNPDGENPVTLPQALSRTRTFGPVVLLVRYGRYGHAIAAEDFLVYDTFVSKPTWFADWQFRYTTYGRWGTKKGGHVRVFHAFLLDKKPLTNAEAPAIVSV